MAAAVVDTSFVLALLNADDRNRAAARSYYLQTSDDLLLPALTLPELAFLLHRVSGAIGMRQGLSVIRSSDFEIIDLVDADYARVIEILTKYADSRIDFVDACLMALAERLRIEVVLTFDRRDFGLYRPRHRERFTLKPD